MQVFHELFIVYHTVPGSEGVGAEVPDLSAPLVLFGDNGVGENEIRELFKVKKPLSRLLVTHDKRIVLPDYNNLEIKMEPIHKAVYLLFLNHPEGIRFKELPDYREELAGIYRAMKLSTQAKKKVERSIIDVTDP